MMTISLLTKKKFVYASLALIGFSGVAFGGINHDVNQVCQTFKSAAALPPPDVATFKGWTTFYKGAPTTYGFVWHSSPNDDTPFYPTNSITVEFDKEITADEIFKACGLMAEELFLDFYSVENHKFDDVSVALALGESGWFTTTFPDFSTGIQKFK